MCVCVFFPSILDIKFVGRTSRGHTGVYRLRYRYIIYTVFRDREGSRLRKVRWFFRGLTMHIML